MELSKDLIKEMLCRASLTQRHRRAQAVTYRLMISDIICHLIQLCEIKFVLGSHKLAFSYSEFFKC